MMEWFVRCIDCRSKISVDGVDWSHANRIHMVCEKCNRRNTYVKTGRRTQVTGILTIQWSRYKNKLYSNRKITTTAIVAMVIGMLLPALDIPHLPLEILASVVLAFFMFVLGSGRVKIECSKNDALNFIKVRHV